MPIAGPFSLAPGNLGHCSTIRICIEWDQGAVSEMEIAESESYS